MKDLDSTELIIGDQPQFFFDNGLIEEVQNVTRTLHSPQKIDRNPLIQRDRPWEHVTTFNASDWELWRDDESGRFHCTYTDLHVDREKLARVGGTLIDWDISRLRQMYAYSDDGLDWIKPSMGLVHEAGHDTNIVMGSEEFGNVWGFSPIDDSLESDPARRYKALFVHAPPGFKVADESPGAHIRSAHSADGVRWTVDEAAPTFGSLGSRLGDAMFPALDPTTGGYLLNTRHPLMELAPRTRTPHSSTLGGSPGFNPVVGASNRRSVRRIFQCESRDFRHWTEPRLILAPDPDTDNLDDALYAMGTLRIGAGWLGFIQVFHMVNNTSEIQLAHSRDGRNWDRLAAGVPWMTNGPAGSWDEFQMHVPRVIPHGDEMWVYYGGASCHHDWWIVGQQEGLDVEEAHDWSNVRMGLGLAKMRLNGFVSLGAHRVREGMLAIQPVVAAGDRLLINAACGPDGYVKVEVADVREQVLPGRSHEQCDMFTGDATSHMVTWGGDSHLPMPSPSAAGTVYASRPEHRRLRFIMRDAEIYSFQIVESESGR
jgi:hypothetical protein